MMKFALCQGNEIGDIKTTYREAFDERNLVGKSALHIRPLLTRQEYEKMSPDFKGELEGEPSVLYFGDGGTTYGPAIIFENALAGTSFTIGDQVTGIGLYEGKVRKGVIVQYQESTNTFHIKIHNGGITAHLPGPEVFGEDLNPFQ